jgi:hypothetical protein
LAEEIRLLVPPRLQLCEEWKLVYSLEEHGVSLGTLYKNCEDFRGVRNGFVLVVRDGEGGVSIPTFPIINILIEATAFWGISYRCTTSFCALLRHWRVLPLASIYTLSKLDPLSRKSTAPAIRRHNECHSLHHDCPFTIIVSKPYRKGKHPLSSFAVNYCYWRFNTRTNPLQGISILGSE